MTGTAAQGQLLDHVSFRYAQGSSAVLDNVSLHARPGAFVAITG